MKIEEISIEQIKPYERNNRTHPEKQIERIAASIKQFGFNQPIVVDENNVVLVGHGRLLAAQKLGLQKISVVIKKDLSEKQKRAYRILDNKLQNDSTWEFENLESELKLLEDEGFELEPWGLEMLQNSSIGSSPKEIDESIADGCEVCICQNCGNEHAK